MSGPHRHFSQDRIDCNFMGTALNMARRGLGTTAPNPSVGAVIVDNTGIILGRGWTQPGGRPHAEIVALGQAGRAARGATLYVTLEPCSHFGSSPPCADAVVAAGIKRVVCGVPDPNELVAGRGFSNLRAAGIEVTENIRAKEAYWLTLGHILKVTRKRPFVQLKIATGSDGLIAAGDGEPVWVTGPQARAQGHLLRARADAILVGIGTVLADDPALDCRLPGMGERCPRILVLDRQGRLPVDATVARSDKLQAIASRHSLADLLSDLADNGLTRLLIEGGPHIWRSFMDTGSVDEVVHFQGPEKVGPTGLRPFVNQGLTRLEQSVDFEKVDQRSVGSDKMIVYRNKNSMKAN